MGWLALSLTMQLTRDYYFHPLVTKVYSFLSESIKPESAGASRVWDILFAKMVGLSLTSMFLDREWSLLYQLVASIGV